MEAAPVVLFCDADTFNRMQPVLKAAGYVVASSDVDHLQETALRSEALVTIIDAQIVAEADSRLIESLRGSTGSAIAVILTSKDKVNRSAGGQVVEVVKRPVDRERLLRTIVGLDLKRSAAV
jgi:GTP-binding protein EngB required for normal cell division